MEPFQPARAWANPHVQTALVNRLRPTDGVRFSRVRLNTPDGDFINLDFADVEGVPLSGMHPQSAPLVLLLHGLEGSARRGYACETYRQLARRGIRAVGMNFRSCGGEINRTARLYHAGATDDVALVVNWLERLYPGVPKGLVGFSLGANVALKYLGEQGDATPLAAAAAVSPPFDMLAGAGVMEQGSGRVYARRFLRDLQRKTLRHARLLGERVDLARVMAARTLRDFDDAVTAPLHGFRDAIDYYERCSSGRFLPAIRVPTLLLRALDDPFFAVDVPETAVANNPALISGITPQGGHVAFGVGPVPWRFSYWAERQAARFLATFLRTNPQNRV